EDVAKLKVKNPNELAFVTQTTLSVDDASVVIDALKKYFPKINGPRKDDICYATQNRQDAVKNLAEQCDVVLVVGSKNSSNSNRLRELSNKLATPAYLIDSAQDIDPNWFIDMNIIGLTAGASAPEILVQDVVARLKTLGVNHADENDGIRETVEFSMPKALRIDISELARSR
ncbi:MAG: 4-hydroxy-3-methylbut-2-enyl diphosphate reductase, partial [Methylophagaceae bacterium]